MSKEKELLGHYAWDHIAGEMHQLIEAALSRKEGMRAST
jgi:hypothetical protein